MNIKNIVFICDDNYVMQTCVAITSIIKNIYNPKSYNFYIICDDISSINKNHLNEMSSDIINIKIIEVTTRDYSVIKNSNGKVTRSSILKFFIPSILENIDVALYLDGDIICNRDIEEIFDINIDHFYAGVVKDGPKDKNLGGKWHSYYANDEYFNSGVMLLNLRKMRDDNIPEKLIDFRLNRPNYFMDQDSFNCVLKGKVKYIDLRYNFMLHLVSYKNRNFSIKQLEEFYNIKEYKNIDHLYNDTYIFHFTFEKPWKFYDIPFNEKWIEYYYQSPFRDSELSRISFTKCLYDTLTYQVSLKISNILRKIIPIDKIRRFISS